MAFKLLIKKILTVICGRDLRHVSGKVKNVDVVSFDIFDTLIRRKIGYGKNLFECMNDDVFESQRIEAERKARENTTKEEVTLDEIYEYLDGYNSEDEIDKEIEVCCSNPYLFELFHKVKETGKRVIVISDMYLSKETLSTILIRNGYDLSGVKLYVSSEYGVTKRSGNLFKAVIKGEGTKSILHIGDNLLSDFLIPKIVGIKGYLYREKRSF